MARKTGKIPEFFSRQVLEANRFYLDAPARGRRPLTVACGGCEHCRTDYCIDRANFPYHSIEFVARGRGTVTLEGVEHALLPGSVFTYGPGIPHTLVKEVAYEFGFHDPFHFSRAFKKIFGLSPEAFRRLR